MKSSLPSQGLAVPFSSESPTLMQFAVVLPPGGLCSLLQDTPEPGPHRSTVVNIVDRVALTLSQS